MPVPTVEPGTQRNESARVDESLIVQKISEFQQLPDAESENFISDAGHRRSAQRTVLLGEGEQ